MIDCRSTCKYNRCMVQNVNSGITEFFGRYTFDLYKRSKINFQSIFFSQFKIRRLCRLGIRLRNNNALNFQNILFLSVTYPLLNQLQFYKLKARVKFQGYKGIKRDKILEIVFSIKLISLLLITLYKKPGLSKLPKTQQT